jgi:Raf kinase inhibitor-like YbhB/YbcL family protein
VPPVVVGALTAAALAWIGVELVVAVKRSARRRDRALELVRGLRIRHVWPAPFVLGAILASLLVLYQVPPLRWGWWTALGGQGNVVFGTTSQTEGTFLEVLIPVVFGLLLLPALPLLVESEERRFRLGAEAWTNRRRAVRGLQFGLLHLVAGIPIAAALSLSIAGWWLTAVYVRAYRRTRSQAAAFDESVRAHLGYDLAIVALVLGGIVLGGCASGADGLRVSVDGVTDGGTVPMRLSCLGDNAPPVVRWRGGPSAPAGWAVVVEDPDAPTGTFTHWVVTGLAPQTRSLDGSALPAGAVASKATSGQLGWVGPCPPIGQTHHYRFRVHALSAAVHVDPATPPDEARRQIEAATTEADQVEARFTGS